MAEYDVKPPSQEAADEHKAYCNKLFVTEGLKGMAIWGVVGSAMVLAARFAFPQFRKNWRIQAVLVTMSGAAGFGVRSETAGTLCARYPPWVLESIAEKKRLQAEKSS